jgi:hypothetical protein
MADALQQLPASTSTSRSYFGDVVLLAFVIAQTLDGAFTYLGVTTYGSTIEANPVVAWYIGSLGAAIGLVGIKALGLVCAATLHRCNRHRTLGILTVLYLLAAVLPWTRVLWP